MLMDAWMRGLMNRMLMNGGILRCLMTPTGKTDQNDQQVLSAAVVRIQRNLRLIENADVVVLIGSFGVSVYYSVMIWRLFVCVQPLALGSRFFFVVNGLSGLSVVDLLPPDSIIDKS